MIKKFPIRHPGLGPYHLPSAKRPVPAHIWWKTDDETAGQRLDSFLGVEEEEPEVHVALFVREDGAIARLAMRNLGDLAAYNRGFLDFALSVDERDWRTREANLAQTGARCLHKTYGIELADAFRQEEDVQSVRRRLNRAPVFPRQ